ncbi:MAG: hypothetical protein JWP39_3388, partial [Jatrophihabitans sp.]|nr:hypothetical protein [Jatrophihabitans sp.]
GDVLSGLAHGVETVTGEGEMGAFSEQYRIISHGLSTLRPRLNRIASRSRRPDFGAVKPRFEYSYARGLSKR